MGKKEITKIKQITITEELFSDLVIQVGTLKEIYDKIAVTREMNGFQKKVLLQNKEKNSQILRELEEICNKL